MQQKRNNLDWTIEQLENDNWGAIPSNASFLVKRIYELRKQKLKNLEIEDLRLLISQGIALAYTIPLSMDILRNDIMSEGDYYEGDLLFAVLTVGYNYWLMNMEEAEGLKQLYLLNEKRIQEFDTTDSIKEDLASAFGDFNEKIV